MISRGTLGKLSICSISLLLFKLASLSSSKSDVFYRLGGLKEIEALIALVCRLEVILNLLQRRWYVSSRLCYSVLTYVTKAFVMAIAASVFKS